MSVVSELHLTSFFWGLMVLGGMTKKPPGNKIAKSYLCVKLHGRS